MKVLAVFATLVASASAFVSSPPSATTLVALEAAVDSMPGKINFRRQEFFFDPLALSTTYEPFLPFFRESELRHGRTAMLAVVGMIIPDFVRIPGEAYSFEAIPHTVDAHNALIGTSMSQILLWVSLWDTVITLPAVAATMKGEREPGDYAWHFWKPQDDEKYKYQVDSELLNGRLAMMAIGGIFTQTVLTGKGFPFI